jgi:hypothetical protein
MSMPKRFKVTVAYTLRQDIIIKAADKVAADKEAVRQVEAGELNGVPANADFYIEDVWEQA